MEGADTRHDRDAYQEASRLLEQLSVAGNLVAQEYMHHVGLMEATMQAYVTRSTERGSGSGGFSVREGDGDDGLPGGAAAGADVPWSEPSLQQLLSQPVLDLEFLEAAVREDCSQGTCWLDVDAGS